MAIRVLVADDQRLVLAAMRRLLEDIPGICVVDEVSSAGQVVAAVRIAQPDVVVLEIAMPGLDGFDAIARIRASVPGAHVLVVSARADLALVRGALAAGATGYILKDCAPGQLRLALDAALRGETYLSAKWWSSALAGPTRRRARGYARPSDPLSPRQREILQLIALGHGTKRIASTLGVSAKTVETHRAAMMQRLGIGHVAGLVMYALRHDLVRLDAR